MGASYILGNENQIIEGPVFNSDRLYYIKASVINAESVRSNLSKPQEFGSFVTITQKYSFYITVSENLTIK